MLWARGDAHDARLGVSRGREVRLFMLIGGRKGRIRAGQGFHVKNTFPSA